MIDRYDIMNYFICFQNCIEDYFFEDAPSLMFPSFDAAIRYLTSLTTDSTIPVPKLDGDIKFYFPSCDSDGVLHDADPDVDRLEMYQIINIIPSCDDHVSIRDCYGDDPDAIISMRRDYTMDCRGHVENVVLGEIQYLHGEE